MHCTTIVVLVYQYPNHFIAYLRILENLMLSYLGIIMVAILVVASKKQ